MHKIEIIPKQVTIVQECDATFEVIPYSNVERSNYSNEHTISWQLNGETINSTNDLNDGPVTLSTGSLKGCKITSTIFDFNKITINFDGLPRGSYLVTVIVDHKNDNLKYKLETGATVVVQTDINGLFEKAKEFVQGNFPTSAQGFRVALQRPSEKLTDDLVLWSIIKHQTDQLKFNNIKDNIGDDYFNKRGVKEYNDLKGKIEEYMTENVASKFDIGKIKKVVNDELSKNSGFTVNDTDALVQGYFDSLKNITITSGNNFSSPYLEKISMIDDNFINDRLDTPVFLELIWSYWHEEGMLAQTMNAICLRFQNKSNPSSINKLAHLATSPLKSLSNSIWGYIQDEPNRLTVNRRAFEYMQHYGLPLLGKAINTLDVVESRSKFLEALHNLLNRCAHFYKEVDDTTIYADAFPVLKALAEVHLVLAEGANNQYGDLPWTARADMMLQQLIIARPEMREFLTVRTMVPYEEQWMGHVDTMKRLQNWSDVTITHFHNLAVWGEQILLSIRHGDWNDSDVDPAQAANWAKFWRTQIQGYLHAYRAVTGVDLTTEPINSELPSILLQKRLAAQGARV